ncbi:MAG: hypothetical protein QW177_01775 [Candidatus Nitrosotenuis sp.]
MTFLLSLPRYSKKTQKEYRLPKYIETTELATLATISGIKFPPLYYLATFCFAHMAQGISKLEEIYDKIEAEQSKPMSEADGYRWGLDYLEDIVKQLEKLEQAALKKNDPLYHHNIKVSIQRAREAQTELSQKIGKLGK